MRPTPATALVVIALVVALGGSAYAVTSFVGSNGQIHGCVAKGGKLILVKPGSKCKKGTPIAWNQKGEKGRQGVRGLRGLRGLTGAPGPGASSIAGLLLGPTPTQVLSVGGLTLTASCDPGSKPSTLTVQATSDQDARFEINYLRTSNETPGPTAHEAGPVLSGGASAVTVLSEGFPNSTDDNENAGGTFVYSKEDGTGAVTGTFHIYMQNGGGECDLVGNATPST